MRENQRLIEDMVTLGGNLLGNLLGARHEMKAHAKQRMDSLARQLDLVSRGEFDAAFAMLAKARLMQEELSDRLDRIESKMNLSSTKTSKKATKLNLPSVKKGNQKRKRK
ncbi:MAG: accessory factor UbiK family protein [Alphaproteobacteria bacterium]